MDEKMYDLCDWGMIEAIVYSEHDNPHTLLGGHITEAGILISCFIPTAEKVILRIRKTNTEYEMIKVEEEGYYSVLIPGKKVPNYTFIVTYDNGITMEVVDPYSFQPVIDATDMKLFGSGIHYNIYEKLGSHVMEIDGVMGVLFAVWAPNAIRVSVVGDFNLWDGRRHPMRRLDESGIFELFIPGLIDGENYKYEIKIKGDLVILKADPYAYYSELRPATASVVHDLSGYQWGDQKWMDKRKQTDFDQEPMLIYELHLGSWRRPEEKEFYNYREIAPMLADYIKEMGYTHIELMPIMEHPLDASWGYQVTGYYATTSRYGKPEDFMFFMDYMHKNNIGVILDWVPAHFPRDAFGLANFDGTCLYEHLDPRQGSHPHWGTLIYNYGRPQVANFLIANAHFWIEKYHMDGIRMDAVASMLYLDYGKNDGEWVANIYGGNENLEAVEMIKHLNSTFKARNDGAILIAEESTAWPKITGELTDNSLGFNYKWNMGWMNDFTNYMKCDPLFRKGRHGELTFSMIYAYSEKFILVFSHDEVVHGKGSMINKMPGDSKQKFDNLRVAYGFMMAHPGKKLLFMGQDIAQFSEWNEETSVEWEILEIERHAQMKNYMKALNRLYKDYSAFYIKDFDLEGFEWINSMDTDRSIISFLRKNDNREESILVVCNFTPVVYENYMIGVPYDGKYKEIFSSDKETFGGSGHTNPRLKQSKPVEVDERENSISITVPPLGISVYTCKPNSDKKIIPAKEEPKIQEPSQSKDLKVKRSTKEKLATEKAIDEKAIDEKAIDEKAIDEKAAMEKATKNKLIKEKSIKEKSIKEKSIKEKSIKEKIATEKATKVKAITEKATKEKATKEKATKEKPIKEKIVKEKATKEKPTKEKVVKEKATKEIPVKEKATKDNPIIEKIIKEKVAKNKATKEKQTKEIPTEKDSTVIEN